VYENLVLPATSQTRSTILFHSVAEITAEWRREVTILRQKSPIYIQLYFTIKW